VGTSQETSSLLKNTDICIEKRECQYRMERGYKLILCLKLEDKTIMTGQSNYFLTDFLNLSDSLKLQIVGKLLLFRGDTSIVCIPVSNYGYEGYENTCNPNPKSKKFPVQLDALYLINKLCFPHSASFYYCYPVLMDTITENEVTTENYLAIENIYEVYERWYDTVKRNGLIEKEFPFNIGRYVWFGGMKSKASEK